MPRVCQEYAARRGIRGKAGPELKPSPTLRRVCQEYARSMPLEGIRGRVQLELKPSPPLRRVVSELGKSWLVWATRKCIVSVSRVYWFGLPGQPVSRTWRCRGLPALRPTAAPWPFPGNVLGLPPHCGLVGWQRGGAGHQATASASSSHQPHEHSGSCITTPSTSSGQRPPGLARPPRQTLHPAPRPTG